MIIERIEKSRKIKDVLSLVLSTKEAVLFVNTYPIAFKESKKVTLIAIREPSSLRGGSTLPEVGEGAS